MHLLQISSLFMWIGADWTIRWDKINETGRTRQHNGAEVSAVSL